MGSSETASKVSFVKVIGTAIQIPGVKVNRQAFLSETFKDLDKEQLTLVLEKGPVEAGVDREELHKKANRVIGERTAISSSTSFLAGLPGGFAIAATIPADMLQFYGVALRLAQELTYLYGESDLWTDDILDEEKVTNQLILYCGVMFGASGAAQTVRVLSSTLAKQALKKLPQKALTKTFYYPIVKSIARFFGVSMTKSVFAKGISKVVPVIGGVVAGGITLATMLPMGQRLVNTLDMAKFEYTNEVFEADWKDIVDVIEEESKEEELEKDKVEEVVKQEAEVSNSEVVSKPKKISVPAWLTFKKGEKSTAQIDTDKEVAETDFLEKIRQAKQMLDDGILTEEEFVQIKTQLISEI